MFSRGIEKQWRHDSNPCGILDPLRDYFGDNVAKIANFENPSTGMTPEADGKYAFDADPFFLKCVKD